MGTGRTGGAPRVTHCEIGTCTSKAVATCNMHFKPGREVEPIRRFLGLRVCTKHYGRWYRHGDPLFEREPYWSKPMPPAELVRLRRLVGVPDAGPSARMNRRWAIKERQEVATWT